MKAELNVRLDRAANGVVHASGSLAVPPFWCRWDGDTLWLVGSAATPVGDDNISITVEVGRGVVANVRNVAATVIYAGSGAGTKLRTDISVAEGAALRWQPEPIIVTSRALHENSTTVHVSDGGSIIADEVVVFGRTDETAGQLRSTLELHLGGRRAALTSFDTSVPGWNGPGGTNGAKVLATRVAVDAEPTPLGDRSPVHATSVMLQPERGGAITTALGPTPRAVRQALEQRISALPANGRVFTPA